MILSGNITQEEIQEADNILADCSQIFGDTEDNSDMECFEQGEIVTKEPVTYLKRNQVSNDAKQINTEENEKHLYEKFSSNTFVRSHLPELSFAIPLIDNNNSFSNKEDSQMSVSDNNFESNLSINNINNKNVTLNKLSTQCNNKNSKCCIGTPTEKVFHVLNKKSNTTNKGKVNTINDRNLKIKRNSLKYYFFVKSKADSSVKKQLESEPQKMKKTNLLKQMNIKTMLLKANKNLYETHALFSNNDQLSATSNKMIKREQTYFRNKINETPLTQSKALFPEVSPAVIFCFTITD